LPTWAPDGSGIAFMSNRGGNWALFVMRPDGSDQRQLLDLGPRAPAWQDQRISWAP
jgi:Tol biopolymer transport system component